MKPGSLLAGATLLAFLATQGICPVPALALRPSVEGVQSDLEQKLNPSAAGVEEGYPLWQFFSSPPNAEDYDRVRSELREVAGDYREFFGENSEYQRIDQLTDKQEKINALRLMENHWEDRMSLVPMTAIFNSYAALGAFSEMIRFYERFAPQDELFQQSTAIFNDYVLAKNRLQRMDEATRGNIRERIRQLEEKKQMQVATGQDVDEDKATQVLLGELYIGLATDQKNQYARVIDRQLVPGARPSADEVRQAERDHLAQAQELYTKAFEADLGYYSGSNVIRTLVYQGEIERAQEFSALVRRTVFQADYRRSFWEIATLLDLALLNEDLPEVQKRLIALLRIPRVDSDVDSLREHLRRWSFLEQRRLQGPSSATNLLDGVENILAVVPDRAFYEMRREDLDHIQDRLSRPGRDLWERIAEAVSRPENPERSLEQQVMDITIKLGHYRRATVLENNFNTGGLIPSVILNLTDRTVLRGILTRLGLLEESMEPREAMQKVQEYLERRFHLKNPVTGRRESEIVNSAWHASWIDNLFPKLFQFASAREAGMAGTSLSAALAFGAADCRFVGFAQQGLLEERTAFRTDRENRKAFETWLKGESGTFHVEVEEGRRVTFQEFDFEQVRYSNLRRQVILLQAAIHGPLQVETVRGVKVLRRNRGGVPLFKRDGPQRIEPHTLVAAVLRDSEDKVQFIVLIDPWYHDTYRLGYHVITREQLEQHLAGGGTLMDKGLPVVNGAQTFDEKIGKFRDVDLTLVPASYAVGVQDPLHLTKDKPRSRVPRRYPGVGGIFLGHPVQLISAEALTRGTPTMGEFVRLLHASEIFPAPAAGLEEWKWPEDLIDALAQSDTPITVDDVYELHHRIMDYSGRIPGFGSKPYVNDRYYPEMRKEMESLLEWVNAKAGERSNPDRYSRRREWIKRFNELGIDLENPLAHAAMTPWFMFHGGYFTEAKHRVGWALMNILLRRAGYPAVHYEPGTPHGENRDRYYQVLDHSEDPRQFIEFIRELASQAGLEEVSGELPELVQKRIPAGVTNRYADRSYRLSYGGEPEALGLWADDERREVYLAQNGPLLFMDWAAAEQGGWRQEVEKVPGLLWVRNLLSSELGQAGLAVHTHGIVAAVRHAGSLEGMLTVESGAGFGIPSLVAKKERGASFAVLLEDDPISAGMARLTLKDNGLVEGKDFLVIETDIRNVDEIARQLRALGRKETQTALISNIGDWEIYSANNQDSMRLIPVIEQATGARVTRFIGGGYLLREGKSPGGALQRDLDQIRQEFGFTPDPSQARFIDPGHQLESVAWVARLPAAASQAGVEEKPFPDPVPVAPPEDTRSPAHKRFMDSRSFLNRHEGQWELMRQKGVLSGMVDWAGRSGNKRIQILVFGASTGEEIARVFHETVRWLEGNGYPVASDPEDSSKWQVEVIGIERDVDNWQEAQKRLQGEAPFVWEAHDNLRASQKYAQDIVQTLNQYRSVARKNLKIENSDFRDEQIIRKYPQAGLILANKVFYHFVETDKLPAIEQARSRWPDAWIAMTYDAAERAAFGNLNPEPVIEVSPEQEFYAFILPRASPSAAAGLEERRYRLEGPSGPIEIGVDISPNTVAPAPVAFIFHGLTGSRQEPHILGVRKLLATMGYLVVAPDFRDHGPRNDNQSGGELDQLTLLGQMEDLARVIQFVREKIPDADLSRVVLGGHSLGGWTAGQAAEEIARGTPGFENIGVVAVASLSGILRPQELEFKNPQALGRFEAYDPLKNLQRIPNSVRYLYVVGEKDPRVSPGSAAAQEFLKAVEARGIPPLVLPGVAHALAEEKGAPEGTLLAVLSHLGEKVPTLGLPEDEEEESGEPVRENTPYDTFEVGGRILFPGERQRRNSKWARIITRKYPDEVSIETHRMDFLGRVAFNTSALNTLQDLAQRGALYKPPLRKLVLPPTAGVEENGIRAVSDFREVLSSLGLTLLHVPADVEKEPDLWKQLNRMTQAPGRLQEILAQLENAPEVEIGWGLGLHQATSGDQDGKEVDMAILPAGTEAAYGVYWQFARQLMGAASSDVRMIRLNSEGIKFALPSSPDSTQMLWSFHSQAWETPRGLLEFLEDRNLTLSLQVPPPAGDREAVVQAWAWVLDPRTLHKNAPAGGGTERWGKPFPLERPAGQVLPLWGFVDDEHPPAPAGEVTPARFVVLFDQDTPQQKWMFEQGIQEGPEGHYRVDLTRYDPANPVRRFLDFLVQNQLKGYGLLGGSVLGLLNQRSIKDLDVAVLLSLRDAYHFMEMEDEEFLLETIRPLAQALGLDDPRELFSGYLESLRIAPPLFEGKPLEIAGEPVVESTGRFPAELPLLSVTHMVILPDWERVHAGDTTASSALLLDPYGGLRDLFEGRPRLVEADLSTKSSSENILSIVFRIVERMALEGLAWKKADPQTLLLFDQLRESLEHWKPPADAVAREAFREKIGARLLRLFRKVHPSGPAAVRLLREFGAGRVTDVLELDLSRLQQRAEQGFFSSPAAGLEEKGKPGESLWLETDRLIDEALRGHPGGLLKAEDLAIKIERHPRTITNHHYEKRVAVENARRISLKPPLPLILLSNEEVIVAELQKYPGGFLTATKLAALTKLSTEALARRNYRRLVKRENGARLRQDPSRMPIALTARQAIIEALRRHPGGPLYRKDLMVTARVDSSNFHKQHYRKLITAENNQRLKLEPPLPPIQMPRAGHPLGSAAGLEEPPEHTAGEHPFPVRLYAGPDRIAYDFRNPGIIFQYPSYGLRLVEKETGKDILEKMTSLLRPYFSQAADSRVAQAQALQRMIETSPEELEQTLSSIGAPESVQKNLLMFKLGVLDVVGAVGPREALGSAMKFLKQSPQPGGSAYGILVDSINHVLTNPGKNPRIRQISAPIQSIEEIDPEKGLELWAVKEGEMTTVLQAVVHLKDGRRVEFSINVAKDKTAATRELVEAFQKLSSQYEFDSAYVMEIFKAGKVGGLGVMIGEWGTGFYELHTYPETGTLIHVWEERAEPNRPPLSRAVSDSIWHRLLWLRAYYTRYAEKGVQINFLSLYSGDLTGAPEQKGGREGPWKHLVIWARRGGGGNLYHPAQLLYSAFFEHLSENAETDRGGAVWLDNPELAIQATVEGVQAHFKRLGESAGWSQDRQEKEGQRVAGLMLRTAYKAFPQVIDDPSPTFAGWNQFPDSEKDRGREVLRRGYEALGNYLQQSGLEEVPTDAQIEEVIEIIWSSTDPARRDWAGRQLRQWIIPPEPPFVLPQPAGSQDNIRLLAGALSDEINRATERFARAGRRLNRIVIKIQSADRDLIFRRPEILSLVKEWGQIESQAQIRLRELTLNLIESSAEEVTRVAGQSEIYRDETRADQATLLTQMAKVIAAANERFGQESAAVHRLLDSSSSRINQFHQSGAPALQQPPVMGFTRESGGLEEAPMLPALETDYDQELALNRGYAELDAAMEPFWELWNAFLDGVLPSHYVVVSPSVAEQFPVFEQLAQVEPKLIVDHGAETAAYFLREVGALKVDYYGSADEAESFGFWIKNRIEIRHHNVLEDARAQAQLRAVLLLLGIPEQTISDRLDALLTGMEELSTAA